ncbi:MAG: hypothetical protein CfClM3_0615 [Methanobrevibacter sp. CfCl-M3]
MLRGNNIFSLILIYKTGIARGCVKNMKEFSYLKLVTAIILIATSIFAASCLATNHAANSGGTTNVYYGDTNAVVVMDTTQVGLTPGYQPLIRICNKSNDNVISTIFGTVNSNQETIVDLPPNLTYYDLKFEIRLWFNFDWYTHVIPWNTAAIVYFDPLVLDNATEDLSNVLVGKLECDSGIPMGKAPVDFKSDSLNLVGLTDEYGAVCFDFTTVPNGTYVGHYEWLGNESAAAVNSSDFSVVIGNSSINDTTNDTTNDTVNDTNISIDGSIDNATGNLSEPFEALPVTGAYLMLFIILAGLAVLFYIWRD